MDFSQQLLILLDVLIASILGGVLGFERQSKEKPAGSRTNMFISGAAALLISLGRYISQAMENELPDQSMGVDPTRLIHAIIVGVSFIGAGTILKNREEDDVKYLTTSAMMLFTAGIGISVALKLYILAVGVTITGLFFNTLLRKISKD